MQIEAGVFSKLRKRIIYKLVSQLFRINFTQPFATSWPNYQNSTLKKSISGKSIHILNDLMAYTYMATSQLLRGGAGEGRMWGVKKKIYFFGAPPLACGHVLSYKVFIYNSSSAQLTACLCDLARYFQTEHTVVIQ
jgi:hypothetical protein